MTCACGGDYTPTPDGVRVHRTIAGHTPCPPRPTPPPGRHRTRHCLRKRHETCGGGVVGGYACECTCHNHDDEEESA